MTVVAKPIITERDLKVDEYKLRKMLQECLKAELLHNKLIIEKLEKELED